MSKYFQVGDRVLWNPSNGVAKLFMDTATAMVPVAGAPLGVEETTYDEYEVDLGVFVAFVNALARRYLSSNHLILRSLIEGFLATALVLVDRAGGTVQALTEATGHDTRDVSAGPWADPAAGAARLRDLAATHTTAMVR